MVHALTKWRQFIRRKRSPRREHPLSRIARLKEADLHWVYCFDPSMAFTIEVAYEPGKQRSFTARAISRRPDFATAITRSQKEGVRKEKVPEGTGTSSTAGATTSGWYASDVAQRQKAGRVSNSIQT